MTVSNDNVRDVGGDGEEANKSTMTTTRWRERVGTVYVESKVCAYLAVSHTQLRY